VVLHVGKRALTTRTYGADASNEGRVGLVQVLQVVELLDVVVQCGGGVGKEERRIG
jgi:hypothetical protein